LAVLAEDDALAVVHRVIADAVLVAAPREHTESDHRADDQQAAKNDEGEGHLVERSVLFLPAKDPVGREARDAVDREEAHHRAGAQERRHRVDPRPLTRGLIDGHSPASVASPRAVMRSRRVSASSARTPLRVASVPGLAVWSWMVAMPNARASGPAVTSTYCMRPYGTTVTERNMRPRFTM